MIVSFAYWIAEKRLQILPKHKKSLRTKLGLGADMFNINDSMNFFLPLQLPPFLYRSQPTPADQLNGVARLPLTSGICRFDRTLIKARPASCNFHNGFSCDMYFDKSLPSRTVLHHVTRGPCLRKFVNIGPQAMPNCVWWFGKLRRLARSGYLFTRLSRRAAPASHHRL